MMDRKTKSKTQLSTPRTDVPKKGNLINSFPFEAFAYNYLDNFRFRFLFSMIVGKLMISTRHLQCKWVSLSQMLHYFPAFILYKKRSTQVSTHSTVFENYSKKSHFTAIFTANIQILLRWCERCKHIFGRKIQIWLFCLKRVFSGVKWPIPA